MGGKGSRLLDLVPSAPHIASISETIFVSLSSSEHYSVFLHAGSLCSESRFIEESCKIGFNHLALTYSPRPKPKRQIIVPDSPGSERCFELGFR